MMIEMKIEFLTVDPSSKKFLVLLMDLENKSALPIWIGPFEANAIALKLKKVSNPRPLTHDLIRNVIQALNCQISRVVVNDLRENTYYALIYIKAEKGEVLIDSRPSATPLRLPLVREHRFLSRKMSSIEQNTRISRIV